MMPNPRHLLLRLATLAIALAAIFAPQNASAKSHPNSETRVRDFSATLPTLTRAKPYLTPDSHYEKLGALRQLASGPPLVPKGGDLFMNRAPLGRTLEHSLNPQAYVDDVAKHYGINLKGTKAIYDPSLGPGQLGVTRAAEGGRIIRIGPDAFVDQATLANTIAHELSHARDFVRGLHKAHGSGWAIGDGSVYGSGNALEDWIRGNR